jgi:hypothetical protein
MKYGDFLLVPPRSSHDITGALAVPSTHSLKASRAALLERHQQGHRGVLMFSALKPIVNMQLSILANTWKILEKGWYFQFDGP